jgi:hypothetical protein
MASMWVALLDSDWLWDFGWFVLVLGPRIHRPLRDQLTGIVLYILVIAAEPRAAESLLTRDACGRLADAARFSSRGGPAGTGEARVLRDQRGANVPGGNLVR